MNRLMTIHKREQAAVVVATAIMLLLSPFPLNAVRAADNPAATSHAPPVNRARPGVGELCALTFDDGPGLYTTALLDLLKARHIKATFFVLGERVLREPEVVLRMAAEGHEVENHSFDHPDLKRLSPVEQEREIHSTQQTLRALGIEPHYFRPPYGAYDPITVREAARDGLVIALWTTDAKDWKYHTLYSYKDDVEQRLPRHIGGIYLFHDIHPWTVQAMPEVLDRLAAGGCRFVLVSQYLGLVTEAEGGGQPARAP